jgi:hypothetical protein
MVWAHPMVAQEGILGVLAPQTIVNLSNMTSQCVAQGTHRMLQLYKSRKDHHTNHARMFLFFNRPT